LIVVTKRQQFLIPDNTLNREFFKEKGPKTAFITKKISI
jgi:hypothetical protein